MPTELLFKIFNTIALLAWLPMLLAPKSGLTVKLLNWKVLPLFLALAYLVILIIIVIQAGAFSMDFSSLQGVKALFGKDEAVLLGWIHYLAFDLLVGMFEFEDAQKRKIPHLLLVPCLFFTFMFGPVGWLMYWGIRSRYELVKQS